MALQWTNKVDGVDTVLADDINYLAQGIIDNEQEITNTIQNIPYIGENGNWFFWDKSIRQYVDSGSAATPTPNILTSITETLEVNSIYNLGTQTALTLDLPSGTISNFIQVDFLSGATPTTLTITSASGLSEYDLTPEANMIYSLYFDWGVLYYDDVNSAYVYGWRFAYAEYVASGV